MRWNDEERAMLHGVEGPATQKAMQIIAALAEVYEAERLVPIVSAQIAGVSYKNLGEAGLEFLEEWAAQGAKVRVPAFMNPAGMDRGRWREMGITPEFAEKQQRVIAALAAMGISPTCSCTPYLVGNVPQAGDHLAWSESSAVSFANSVLAARTNREGGPSALAAAITGRTPEYGLHLDYNRLPTHIINVHCTLRTEADFGALGYMVGQHVGDGIPYFHLGSLAQSQPQHEHLMALGAAMAASGAVALYHIDGVTPEARHDLQPEAGLPHFTVHDLHPGYAALNSPVDEIDFVSLGCPHTTLHDLERVAELLRGRTVKTTLWITTSHYVRNEGIAKSWVDTIEAAGGKVFADTCLVVAPVQDMGFRAMATNSAKAAFFAPAHSGLLRRFGSAEQCIDAALTGRWSGGHNGTPQ